MYSRIYKPNSVEKFKFVFLIVKEYFYDVFNEQVNEVKIIFSEFYYKILVHVSVLYYYVDNFINFLVEFNKKHLKKNRSTNNGILKFS